MPELKIDEEKEIVPGRFFRFRRSDGQFFYMERIGDEGGMVLVAPIIGFDANTADKLGEARRWILSYPYEPAD